MSRILKIMAPLLFLSVSLSADASKNEGCNPECDGNVTDSIYTISGKIIVVVGYPKLTFTHKDGGITEAPGEGTRVTYKTTEPEKAEAKRQELLMYYKDKLKEVKKSACVTNGCNKQ